MYIIIVGCGDVGSRLAQELSQGKDNVVVIERSLYALGKLGSRFNGQTLIGDGMDVKILQEAGIENCDVLFALTDNDNLNLVIAQIAQKIFGVKKVVLQVRDFDKEVFARSRGLTVINRNTYFLEMFKRCIS